MNIQAVLQLHARLVATILTADALTKTDIDAAQELSRHIGGNPPDYVGCIAGANVDHLGDGYVLALAKDLLKENIKGA